jgi:hypothetical protein
LLFPFDVHPDFLPGGLNDDLWIVPILFAFATILIPRIVFQDARKAVVQAICGIICLSLSANSAYQSDFGTCARANLNGLGEMKNASKSFEQRSSNIADRHLERQKQSGSQSLASKTTMSDGRFTFPEPVLLAHNSVICSPHEQTFSSKPIGAVYIPLAHIILTTRGGQYQLYAAENDAAVLKMDHSHRKLVPPRIVGGIFIADSTKVLVNEGLKC